ncbi:hypothetical protein AWB69_02880 [Caballeronia udeis]|uniref:Uncharacterized protein n=1 Tax=Caballeronia udeis TaxID=1232866 RepID=A0A158GL27_9BURK|nr:hypothetical protein AWB69_02880 [Caballeronia udeis]
MHGKYDNSVMLTKPFSINGAQLNPLRTGLQRFPVLEIV